MTDTYFQGWADQVRFAARGTLVFVDLYMGGSTTHKIQVVISGSKGSIKRLGLSRHCALKITGDVVPSPGGEQATEVQTTPDKVTVVGKCDPDTYPISKADLTLEYLRSIPVWRSRTRLFRAVWDVRDEVLGSIHKFYRERGYKYIHTPLITKSDCEGAGEAFEVVAPGCSDFFGSKPLEKSLDPSSKPLKKSPDPSSTPSQPVKAFLTVSGQLQGEIMAAALGPIYTLGPTFRAEKSSTSRHLSEFWMMEPEIPFATLQDIIKISVDMLKYIVTSCYDHCLSSLRILEEHSPGLLVKLERFMTEEAVIMTYGEAIEKLIEAKEVFEVKPEWGIDLGSEHEMWLCGDSLLILTDYPRDIKAFYMYESPDCSPDRQTVACMDVLLPGIGEVIGGSQRESRLDILVPKMEQLGLGGPEYEFYRDIRRFGYAGSGGFGLGVERMVRFVTGIKQIRDVIPFPVTYGKIFT